MPSLLSTDQRALRHPWLAAEKKVIASLEAEIERSSEPSPWRLRDLLTAYTEGLRLAWVLDHDSPFPATCADSLLSRLPAFEAAGGTYAPSRLALYASLARLRHHQSLGHLAHTAAALNTPEASTGAEDAPLYAALTTLLAGGSPDLSPLAPTGTRPRLHLALARAIQDQDAPALQALQALPSGPDEVDVLSAGLLSLLPSRPSAPPHALLLSLWKQ